MSSTYDVVNESPFFKDWNDGLFELAPDVELEQDQTLQSLRKSSNKLIKNNFIAASAQLAYINTILGGKIKTSVMSEDKKLEKSVDFVLDTETVGMDINREFSLTQIAEQIVTSAFSHGDVLINLPMDNRSKRKVKTYVELIEASRIKTPPKHKDNTLVREGVHYYESGRLKGYWVIKRNKENKNITYWSATDNDFEFFPAYKKKGSISRKVSYLFKAPLNLRPGQSRGIPVLTPVMELLRYINQYLEAVLVGARVAACFAGFIHTSDPAGARKSMTEGDTDPTVEVKGKKLTKLKPGTLSYLRLNESITFASPNKPSDNFDDFILRLAKFVAMTLRVPYEHMFLDLGATSFSSWRGGSLETERNINRWKRDLEQTLRWILFTFLQESMVVGELKGNLKKMTLKITFPVYKTLDEEKSSRARKTNLGTESTSQHREQDGLGQSYEELQDELDVEALRRVERQIKILKMQKEASEKFGIIFPDQETESRDTSGSRRTGESEGEDLDEDDAKERRRDDDNN